METSMSRQDLLEIYRSATPVIAPSMLGCDFGNLHREVELLTAALKERLKKDIFPELGVRELTWREQRMLEGMGYKEEEEE